MLVLTRKSGQGVWIGDNVRVIVLEVKEGQIRLGIEAARDTAIYRDEVYKRIQDQNLASSVLPTDMAATLKSIAKKGK